MSAYPSLISPLMNPQGLITTSALNSEAQEALNLASINAEQIQTLQETSLQRLEGNYKGTIGAGLILRDAEENTVLYVDGASGDVGAKGAITGSGFANTDSSFEVDYLGNCTVNELTYTSLNPPIAPSATPTLAEVLTVSGDGGNKAITNVETIYTNNVITSGFGLEAPQVAILKQDQSGYYYQTSNASGVDLNTKFTSDGLILHKVSAGSDITIQNDANNLVTLGTATGYADLKVGVLNYTSLNPAIGGEWVPTATSDLDMANYNINNVSQLSFGGTAMLEANVYKNQLQTAVPFTCTDNQATSSMSCYNTTDYIPTFYADSNSNAVGTQKSASLSGWGAFDANTITAKGASGYVMSNNDASFKVAADGEVVVKSVIFNAGPAFNAVSDVDISVDNSNLIDINELTCTKLNCSTFNPPISTPTLAQVLAVGADGNQVDITNCGNITASGFTTTGQVDANNLLIKDNTQTVVAGIDSIGLISGSQLNIGGVAQIDTVGNITCSLVNGVKPEFKPTYNYFVSKGGNDTEGLGSILSPFLTIQKAITVCEAFTDGVPRVVNVLAGSYVENLTLTKSRISIIGQGQSSRPDVGTAIYGTITITIASGNSDLNNNNIYFSGFLINGQIEDNTSSVSYPHRVFFDRCQLYANNRVLYLHPAGDYRAFVSNCVISNDNTSATDPVVECYSSSTGMVSFTSNQVTSKGTSQNVFKLSGSCRTDTFAQNIFTSDSTGTNVAIAIFVHSSTAVITIGQNAFVYSSSGAKRNADTASGIFMNAASAGGSIVLANNVFGLTGLPLGQNAVQNNSAAGVVIFGGNISTSSTAGTSAFAISGALNSTKFAMTAVQ